MKKIYKAVKAISAMYKSYQIRVTNNFIEVKFTPISDSEDEVVFVSDNNKEGMLDMKLKLHMAYETGL